MKLDARKPLDDLKKMMLDVKGFEETESEVTEDSDRLSLMKQCRRNLMLDVRGFGETESEVTEASESLSLMNDESEDKDDDMSNAEHDELIFTVFGNILNAL